MCLYKRATTALALLCSPAPVAAESDSYATVAAAVAAAAAIAAPEGIVTTVAAIKGIPVLPDVDWSSLCAVDGKIGDCHAHSQQEQQVNQASWRQLLLANSIAATATAAELLLSELLPHTHTIQD